MFPAPQEVTGIPSFTNYNDCEYVKAVEPCKHLIGGLLSGSILLKLRMRASGAGIFTLIRHKCKIPCPMKPC